MDRKEIRTLIQKKLNLKKILISTQEKNVMITAIGDYFLGMNSLEKQQVIYKILLPYFFKKKIHAITIQAYTLDEWNTKKTLLKINK